MTTSKITHMHYDILLDLRLVKISAQNRNKRRKKKKEGQYLKHCLIIPSHANQTRNNNNKQNSPSIRSGAIFPKIFSGLSVHCSSSAFFSSGLIAHPGIGSFGLLRGLELQAKPEGLSNQWFTQDIL